MDFVLRYWLEMLFAAVAGGVVALYRRQRAVENGVQALLRDRIVQAYFHYEERGDITLHGKENLEKMFREYKNLGGNGMVSGLIDDLRKLDVVDK